MKPSLIIFDFDGVLVNTQDLVNRLEWSFLKQYGLKKSLQEYAGLFSGKKSLSTLKDLRTEREIPDFLKLENLAQRLDDHVLENLLKEEIHPVKGVKSMLKELPFKKCVASNCSLIALQSLLFASGLAREFNGHIFAADMVEAPKPAPDLFLYAARKMKEEPSNCLVIEDSPVGVQAAVQAGMKVWGFIGAHHVGTPSKESLLALGAEETFSDMELLPQRLETESEEEIYSPLRHKMVKTQLRERGLQDERVLKAMGQIPRHLFVPSKYRSKAYMDSPLPIGYRQTISQPYIVALMCQLAKLSPDDKVLEIGTGSGYQAAILSHLVKSVYTIEIVLPLAETAKNILEKEGFSNVHVKIGDGYFGWKKYQSYDAILITAESEEVPRELVKQLKVGGRLIMPLKQGSQTYLVRFKKEENQLKKEIFEPVHFVPFQRSGDKI